MLPIPNGSLRHYTSLLSENAIKVRRPYPKSLCESTEDVIPGQVVREVDEQRTRNGKYLIAKGQVQSTNMMIDDEITIAPAHGIGSDELRRRKFDGHSISEAISVERIASSMFVIGATPSQSKARSRQPKPSHHSEMPRLSSQVTIGRNSMFQNLTKEDRELLGGLEYRALKLLLKIVIGNTFHRHT